MRNLYWKIFLSFWLVIIVVMMTTMYVTGLVTHRSTIPANERIVINSYANAAVATYESGHRSALIKWLKQTHVKKHVTLYLLEPNGDVIADGEIPQAIKKLALDYSKQQLSAQIMSKDKFIISHEILTASDHVYRVAVSLNMPITHLSYIPWAGMSLVLLFFTCLSGSICYLLSLYLTSPIRDLRLVARSITRGKLKTRVGDNVTKRNDEIAELGQDFDSMAEHIEHLIVSKERLLQDISHELRSPLARMQIALELARTKTDKSTFDRMELEIHRLDDLIGDIMTLAKMQTSKLVVNPININLTHLVQVIVDDANFEFSEINTEFHAPEIDIQIDADEKILYHALENIVRNALKYTKPATQVTVNLIDAPKEITITVTDEGPGVPEEYLDKIFDPFLRVDSARNVKTGGYGLGLAITKKAIMLHRGKIFAENQDGSGLKVTIIIPKH